MEGAGDINISYTCSWKYLASLNLIIDYSLMQWQRQQQSLESHN